MSGFALQTGGYKKITATGNVSAIPCKLVGIFVSTATAGTIQVYDSATNTTTAPITGAVAAVGGTWLTIPVGTSAGLYVVITGTVDATVVFA